MPHFHLDILPALPNPERLPTGILLTDTELTRWQKSNPKAYADWFYDRMRTVFLERRAILAKSLEETVEEVPEWQVRTPLQIAVQILKRHRDIFFQDNLDDKPPSIIITTLAALAYNNQTNIYDALADIVRKMPTKIEYRNNKWWIQNPVDPDENFADKWNEYPERRENFNAWLKKAQADFSNIGDAQTLIGTVDLLESALGKRAVAIPAANLGLKSLESLPTVFTPVSQIPAIGDTNHCQRPTWLERLHYKATITGAVHHMKTYKKLWALTNRPVGKELRLKFQVKTNTPPPYDVKWQVVNTGKEANDAQGLRGGFYDSDSIDAIDVRWETTSYKGTHWIEAFIIKDGICVARSGHKIVRIR